MTTEREIKTKKQLHSVIDYIIWSYDENCSRIKDKYHETRIEERDSVFIVTIHYLIDIRRAHNPSLDPTLAKDDEQVNDSATFTLLKSEGFRQLTKYVEDICDEIAKIKIDA